MAFQGDSIYWVEVGKIVPNPYQPRREFDEGKLKELAESIRMYGVLQPLTVTRKEIQRDDGTFFSEYELIAGERRLRASRLAGLAQVPVIIRDSDDSEQEKLELAIIENLQREDLNAVDRALAFQQLADAFKLSHADVAKKVGRSREYVSNSIRLLGLPDYMLTSLKVGDISEGHARTLLMLKDRPEEQDVVYREILLKKLSVREVERIVRKIATDKVRKKNWQGTDPHLIEIEKEFTDALGTRVQIAKTDYGGKVTIDYFSEEDLDKLLQLLKAEQGKPAAVPRSVPQVTELAAVMAATPLTLAETEPAADEPMEQPEESAASEAAPADDEAGDSSADSTNEAIESEEHSSDALEDYVIERAQAAGAEAYRPTPEERVEQSESVKAEFDAQVENLQAHEASYTPPAQPTAAEETEPKPETPPDDESDLYSLKGFGI